MISFIKRVSVIGASIGVVEVVGRFEYPGGAEGLAKVMAEKHPLVPVRLEEVEATMGYLDGLSEEDGDSLLHFDRDSELITTGRNSVQFRLFVATILPSGFEDMAIGPGEESSWSDDVFEPLGGHRQCSINAAECEFIRAVLARTPFGMAAFFRERLLKYVDFGVYAWRDSDQNWTVFPDEFVLNFISSEPNSLPVRSSPEWRIVAGAARAQSFDQIVRLAIHARRASLDELGRVDAPFVLAFLWNSVHNEGIAAQWERVRMAEQREALERNRLGLLVR